MSTILLYCCWIKQENYCYANENIAPSFYNHVLARKEKGEKQANKTKRGKKKQMNICHCQILHSSSVQDITRVVYPPALMMNALLLGKALVRWKRKMQGDNTLVNTCSALHKDNLKVYNKGYLEEQELCLHTISYIFLNNSS